MANSLTPQQLDMIEQHYGDFSPADQDQAKQLLLQQRPDSNVLMRLHQQEHPPATIQPSSDVFSALMGQKQGPQLPTDPITQMQQMGIMRKDDNPPINDAVLGLLTGIAGAGGAEGENLPALGRFARNTAGKGSELIDFAKHPFKSLVKMGLDQIKGDTAPSQKTYASPPVRFRDQPAPWDAPPVNFPQQQQSAGVPPPAITNWHGGNEVSPSVAAPPLGRMHGGEEVRPNVAAPGVNFRPQLEPPTEVKPAPPINTWHGGADPFTPPKVVRAPPIRSWHGGEEAAADEGGDAAAEVSKQLGLKPPDPKPSNDIYQQQANAKIDPMDAVVKDKYIAGYLKREGYTKEKYDSLTLEQKKDLIKKVPFHNKQPYRWSDDLEARAGQTIRAALPDK